MPVKPYIITIIETHALEYRVHAKSKRAAVKRLTGSDTAIDRTKLLDRTIEIREERNEP